MSEEEEKSINHKVEVVPIELKKHDNADNLSIVPVFGYNCVVRSDPWKDVKLGAWLPPDTLAPVLHPEFAFLAGTSRYYDKDSNPIQEPGYIKISARRFRGEVSYGLLVPAPEGLKVGDDAAEALGVLHYNEPIEAEHSNRIKMVGGENAPAPAGAYPKYDLLSLQRYPELIQEGELVGVSQKLNGSNARYVYKDGQQHCASREEFKKEFASDIDPVKMIEHMKAQGLPDDKVAETLEKLERLKSKPKSQNLWWRVMRGDEGIQKFCQDNEGGCLYGEVVGVVGGFHYGCKPGEVKFYAFDILTADCRWLDPEEFWRVCDKYGVKAAPVLASNYPYNFKQLVGMAETTNKIPGANHICEGAVVSPMKGRRDYRGNRIKLKIVNFSYHNRK